MAWNGYFVYGGNEFINLPRTEAYARDAGWFRPSLEGTSLPVMTGEGQYVSPIIDGAPWTDPDEDASYDFWGFYPLNITGIEDATVTSTVVESTGDGGTPGRVRRGTKTVVFSGMLFAASECGAEYGVRWLRSILNGNACGNLATNTCNGDDLCYLVCEPALNFDLVSTPVVLDPGTPGTPGTPGGDITNTIDGGAALWQDAGSVDGGGATLALVYELLDGGSGSLASTADSFDGNGVSLNTGGGDTILDGGAASQFSAFDSLDGCNALLNCLTGTPGTGGTDPIIGIITQGAQDPADCLDDATRSLRKVVFNNGPTVVNKRVLSDGSAIWDVQFTAVAGSPYAFSVEKPVVQGFMDPAIGNPFVPGVTGEFDLNGAIVDEDPCKKRTIAPVFDPFCPAITVPPSVPNVTIACYNPPANWRRRQFTLDKSLIPLFSDAVPMLKVYARDDEVRNLRLRFYADVNGDGSILDDPCAWCGDIVMSYIPRDVTLIFDASDKVVYVEDPGGLRRRADNLVYATDGGPFEWPALSCGFSYIVTVDLPQTATPPVLDFSLFHRVA